MGTRTNPAFQTAVEQVIGEEQTRFSRKLVAVRIVVATLWAVLTPIIVSFADPADQTDLLPSKVGAAVYVTLAGLLYLATRRPWVLGGSGPARPSPVVTDPG